MKKTLILSAIAGLFMTSSVSYAGVVSTPIAKAPLKQEETNMQKKEHKRNNLDERLKLTEEQKIAAKEIRMKGHEKIKPVFEKIKAKKQEAKMVKMSRIAVQEQERRLAVIKGEIRKLKKEAREIRKQNTKEFEAILTPEQKVEFEKIKKEGREKFKKMHKMKKEHMNKCKDNPSASKSTPLK